MELLRGRRESLGTRLTLGIDVTWPIPYIRYRRGRQKTFALTAVHPAYACEATTAKEPARSQVAELEPCYFTHTLAIEEVGPACSSMAPVPLLEISQAL